MFELGMFVGAMAIAVGIVYWCGGVRGGIALSSASTRRQEDEAVLQRISLRPGVHVEHPKSSPSREGVAFRADTYARQLERLRTLENLVQNTAFACSSTRARWTIRLRGLFDQLEDLTRSGLEPDQGSRDDLRFQRVVRETDALAEEIREHAEPAPVVTST